MASKPYLQRFAAKLLVEMGAFLSGQQLVSAFALSVLALGYQYRAGKLTIAAFKENFAAVLYPLVWVVCLFGCYYVVKAAIDLHRDLKAEVLAYKPAIQNYAPEYPSKIPPVTTVTLLIGFFSIVSYGSFVLAFPPIPIPPPVAPVVLVEDSLAAQIPFISDSKPGTIPISWERPDRFENNTELETLANEVTKSRKPSNDKETTEFLGELLQYDLLYLIDQIQYGDSGSSMKTDENGIPRSKADTNPPVTPPDSTLYAKNKLDFVLAGNRFSRTQWASIWGVKDLQIPRDAELHLSVMPMTDRGRDFDVYTIVIDDSVFSLSFGIIPALSLSPGLPASFKLNPFFPRRRLSSLRTFTCDIKIRCELKQEKAMTAIQVDAYRVWVNSLSSQLKKVFDWSLQ